jgi:heme-degrading monooxygenase HmoA
MAHAVARTRVADFDQFIETFTTRGQAKRTELGSRGSRVFRSAEDPNEVIIVFDWDQEDVQRFLADPEAQEIMREAGLQGPPEFTFVEHHVELEA